MRVHEGQPDAPEAGGVLMSSRPSKEKVLVQLSEDGEFIIIRIDKDAPFLRDLAEHIARSIRGG